MNKIKVSIILPAYNGEKFTAGAIDSVLAQSYEDWELLVINSKENVFDKYKLSDNMYL